MAEDKAQALYNQLTKDGYDLGDFNTFSTKITQPDKAKALHDTIVKDGYDVGDFDSFYSKVAQPSGVLAPTQKPQNIAFTPEIQKGIDINNGGNFTDKNGNIQVPIPRKGQIDSTGINTPITEIPVDQLPEENKFDYNNFSMPKTPTTQAEFEGQVSQSQANANQALTESIPDTEAGRLAVEKTGHQWDLYNDQKTKQLTKNDVFSLNNDALQESNQSVIDNPINKVKSLDQIATDLQINDNPLIDQNIKNEPITTKDTPGQVQHKLLNTTLGYSDASDERLSQQQIEKENADWENKHGDLYKLGSGIARGIYNGTESLGAGVIGTVGEYWKTMHNLWGVDWYNDLGDWFTNNAKESNKVTGANTRGDNYSKAGEQIGGILPIASMMVADTFTGGALTPVITGTFAIGSYSDGVNAYDEIRKKNNLPSNDIERTGSGLLYSLIMAGGTNALMNYGVKGVEAASKSSIFKTAVTDVLKSNPETLQTSAKEIFENYLKNTPSALEKFGKGTLHSVLTMEGLEFGKMGVNVLMGDDPKLKDVVHTATSAAISGVLFKLFTPFDGTLSNKQNLDRRMKQGSVTVSSDGKQSFEIVNTDKGLMGLTPDNKWVKVSKEILDNSITVPTSDFYKFASAYKKTGSVDVNNPTPKVSEQPAIEPIKQIRNNEQIAKERIATNLEADKHIAEAQTRLGLQTTPDVKISDDTETTLDRLDNDEPVTNEFILKASSELYEVYKNLETMNQSDTRLYTIDQIESMKEYLGEEITKLENHATQQKNGEFISKTQNSETSETGTTRDIEQIDPVQSEKNQANTQLADITNKTTGNITKIKLGTGEEGILNGGELKYNKDGSVDKNNPEMVTWRRRIGTDDKGNAIYAKDTDAEVLNQQLVKSVDVEKPLEQAQAEAGQQIDDIAQAEAFYPKETEQFPVDDNGNFVEFNFDSTTGLFTKQNFEVVKQPDGTEEAYLTSGIIDSNEEEYAQLSGKQLPDSIKTTTEPAINDQIDITLPIGDSNVSEKPVPQTFKEQIPVQEITDTKGKPTGKNTTLYEQAPIETTIGALKEQFDPEEVNQVVGAKIKKLESDIAKVGKVKITGDIDTDAANKAASKQALQGLTESLGYWNGVSEALNPVEVVEPKNEINTDYYKTTAEKSNDIADIKNAYDMAMGESGYETLLPWQQELLGMKIHPTSFKRFGDRNYMNDMRGWFTTKKTQLTPNNAIDTIAEVLSVHGIEVTPDMIVDFMREHPDNKAIQGNEHTIALNDRFRKVASKIAGMNVGGINTPSGKLFLRMYNKPKEEIQNAVVEKAVYQQLSDENVDNEVKDFNDNPELNPFFVEDKEPTQEENELEQYFSSLDGEAPLDNRASKNQAETVTIPSNENPNGEQPGIGQQPDSGGIEPSVSGFEEGQPRTTEEASALIDELSVKIDTKSLFSSKPEKPNINETDSYAEKIRKEALYNLAMLKWEKAQAKDKEEVKRINDEMKKIPFPFRTPGMTSDEFQQKQSTFYQAVNKIVESSRLKDRSQIEKTLDDIQKTHGGVGVSHDNLNALASELGLPHIDRGEALSPKEYADRGRKLLVGGANPYDLHKYEGELHDKISIARAHYENLMRNADAIKDKTSKEYDAALVGAEDYIRNFVKPLGNKAGQAMISLQGERDLDTDSFTAVCLNILKENGDKPLTKKQKEAVTLFTDKTAELSQKIKDLEKKLINLTNDHIGERAPRKFTAKKAQEISAKIRDNAKISRPNMFMAATPVSVIWDGAVETVAKSIELGGIASDAIESGLKYIRGTKWYDDLTHDKKEQAEQAFREWQENQFSGKAEELSSLQKMFVDKKNDRFSSNEAKAIWDYAKKHYLSKGESFKDMISSVSNDLGLSFFQVSNAIITPKTKPITDELWKAHYDLNRNRRSTHEYINKQSPFSAIKAFKMVSNMIREEAIFGHGGVFIGTHAGMTLMDLPRAKYTIKAFMNAYKNAYGSYIHYEQAMTDLQGRKNYVIARRAGLQNDPTQINNDSEILRPLFGKLSNSGIRGFNAIKTLRQDLFDNHYNKLSQDDQKNNGVLKEIARLVNNATGSTNIKFRGDAIGNAFSEITFAGGMELARWEKLIGNPYKAGGIGFKAMFNNKDVTPAEKVFVKTWAKRAGWEVGAYLGLLVINSALQSLLNDNENPVNLTDWKKSDWLKMKIGSHTIDFSSGMISTENFIKKIVLTAFGDIPTYEDGAPKYDNRGTELLKTTGHYVRGKLAPAYSLMTDIVSHHDYNGNTLPMYNDKPEHLFNRYLTYKEYLLEHTPIPVSEGVRVFYDEAYNGGVDESHTDNIVKGLMAGVFSGTTGFRMYENEASDTKSDKQYQLIGVQKAITKLVKDLPSQTEEQQKVTNEQISKLKQSPFNVIAGQSVEPSNIGEAFAKYYGIANKAEDYKRAKKQAKKDNLPFETNPEIEKLEGTLYGHGKKTKSIHAYITELETNTKENPENKENNDNQIIKLIKQLP